MAHQDKSDSEKRFAQGTRRRAILGAGLAMPLGSSALLSACGGGGSSEPLMPPPAPTASASAPAPALAPNPVAAPAPPDRSSGKGITHARVLNLQTPTFDPPAHQRLATEDMKTYTQRALQSKFELLRDALAEGLPKQSAPTDICYFVAPEFFWNVNWDAIGNQEDIRIFSETCITEVQRHVRTLIDLFPQERYGKLTLLPGSAQILKKEQDGSVPDPLPAIWPIILPPELPFYRAENYVHLIDNFSPVGANNVRPMGMWPKRNVSSIDFPQAQSTTIDSVQYWVSTLNQTMAVLVRKKSTGSARSYSEGEQRPRLDNNPFGGVAFGIDVCLDYKMAYESYETLRTSQLDEARYVVDFLIACGMPIDARSQKYIPTLQYLVRNDGMKGGACEVVVFSTPSTTNYLSIRAGSRHVPQTQVANPPGSNSFLFDCYFDVHPTGQYPKFDTMPSPIAPPA
jgi:hypothetical protein